MSIKPTPLIERIAAKSELRDNGCLVWTGRFDKSVPVIDLLGGGQRNVRRVVYEHHSGELIGKANTPRMTCTTPGCVHWQHIEIVAGKPAPEVPTALPSVLPRHLKYSTGVRSVWDLGRAA